MDVVSLDMTRQAVFRFITNEGATAADVATSFCDIAGFTPDDKPLNIYLGRLVELGELGFEDGRYIDGEYRCAASRSWPGGGRTRCLIRAGHENGEDPRPHDDGTSSAWLCAP